VNDYSTYIHQSRYARYIPEKGRRETWEETVDRYCQFFIDRIKKDEHLSDEDKQELLRVIG